ncbi:MAG: general glycosylation pathway protein [Chloroflexi bacterium CG07_land_8_20_14_0_80_45_17]|nr:MAG: general glycosylation pathway protein [Chloroflexi bacterium CG23_combo_of_CG06-09_8_20_14_all_45_10]PIU55637.1 MAG: general glycosylation pathway protein [Chloroflexi bacterium CG07_land_8_20_14_0_80_45_17]
MKIKVPYGKAKIEVKVPEDKVLGVIAPNPVQLGDEMATIRKGIENPINSKSFDEFIASGEGLLFIVNDYTRPTPTAKILEVIYDKIKDKNIKFLIATGIHREPNEEEFKFIFGKYYHMFKDRIYVHDSRKDEDMVYLGTSSTGTEMWVNRLSIEADKLVIIGSVEPHYFAGYTGGRKSFLPGIASYKTIEQNHKHALHPQAKALALEGNPVHEDMIDALKTIEGKEIFSVQTVLNKEKRTYSCVSGHIIDSFCMSIEKAHEVYCVRVKEKADIVVTVAGYPADLNLYQSLKAFEHGKLALKEGGIIILVSECRSGIGEETYFNLLSSCKTSKEFLERVEQGYRLGYHKAARLAETTTWAEIWGVTGIKDEDMERAFIKPFPSIQQAIDKAIEKKGKEAKVLFLMDGTLTVPRVINCSKE